MASRRERREPGRAERPGGWIDPEVAPASGGHLAPDPAGVDPLPEGLDPPEPGLGQDPPLTEPLPRPLGGTPAGGGGIGEPQVPPASRRRPVRRRVAVRRVKRTVKHVDPMSVLKLSAFFYAIFLVVWLIFVAILFSILDSLGTFDLVRSTSRVLFDARVTVDLWFVERWALIVGFIIAVVGSLANTVIAFLYNVAADTIGGVEMTFVERDASP